VASNNIRKQNKLKHKKKMLINKILRVFENRVLRRIFGPKREEVAGGW